MRSFSHIAGVDDGPFVKGRRRDVLVVATIFSGSVLTGVLTTTVRQDGRNSTERLVSLFMESKWAPQLQLVMLQGVSLGGFNVVDVTTLALETGLPVLVVSRKQPDFSTIREALTEKVPGGKGKWALVEKLGKMERIGPVFVQRTGLTSEEAAEVIRRTAINGNIPEPLRTAHLIAGGLVTGQSRGRT
ncbi:MAG: DUF99 family protein [Acidobacteria bacterium]|nr:DUF99 family protein [Acidobacteriota bacterium]MCG3194746.1 hypothetical protein [Thermoanaerobaculia bacterium]MCK6682809.1 DUF99 family protein [Thermoanaerobaculia bacterium]